MVGAHGPCPTAQTIPIPLALMGVERVHAHARPNRPLIVSAAGYSHRRNTSRQTFLRRRVVPLVVRLVVLTRMQDGTKEDEMVALEAERLGDVVRVPRSGSRARVSAPVVAPFGGCAATLRYRPRPSS